MKTLIILLSCFSLFLSNAVGAETREKPSLSKGSPARSTTPVEKREQDLIEQLMTVSGLKDVLERLPDQIVTGFVQAFGPGGTPSTNTNEVARIVSDAYPKDGFVIRVRAALSKNYDEQRYSRQLQRLSTPLAKRMAKLESQPPDPMVFQRFASEKASEQLRTERIQLIRKIDSLSGASALNNRVTITYLETIASASVGDCPEKLAEVKKTLAKQRPDIEKATRGSVQIMLAFTYREVSDADLREYLKVYENKDGAWMQRIIQSAIEEQFTAGAKKMVKGLKQIVQPQNQNKTVFAPKCE